MNLNEPRLGAHFTSRRERGNEGLPTLSVTLDRGLVPRDTLERRTETNLSAEEHLRVRPGDIVYNMMRMWQGASGLAKVDALVSPAYIVLSPKKTIDPQFASYLFKLPEMVHRFWAYSYGLTDDRLRLYFNDFKRIPWDVPPLAEQKKIADVLSTWDKAIETTEKLLANAEAQKRALMQQLLTGRQRLKRFEGSEWVEKDFATTFIVDNDKSSQVPKQRYLTDGETPIIDQGKEFIAGFTNQKSRYHKVPAIVFGDHTKALKWVDFAFCPGADGVQILKTRSSTDIRFGYYLLQATPLPDLGYSRHMRELKKAKFTMPSSIDEQRSIAKLFECTDKVLEHHNVQLSILVLEKRALMQQLLRGKRRVTI
ncbi:type I restriction enzyme S subunit [Sinorhizobium medicae]|uniref:restriction endonuclease subunit S n=1 Tax=Sinorhizobium medicae TaxID=110321 RepID=UPI0011A04C32|nr:restriction endonuclease subunit S [Sinorhizobium medicae]MDX1068968.1 restriction endonuclease subunit S [Sinorhizobium medicae]TWA21138.1 type I restriction enzyme S subunit [Sinorhizobium medicae]